MPGGQKSQSSHPEIGICITLTEQTAQPENKMSQNITSSEDLKIKNYNSSETIVKNSCACTDAMA